MKSFLSSSADELRILFSRLYHLLSLLLLAAKYSSLLGPCLGVTVGDGLGVEEALQRVNLAKIKF